jgi:acetyl esterase/lipase
MSDPAPSRARKRRKLRIIPTGALMLMVSAAWQPAAVLNAVARIQPYQGKHDIAYGPGARDRLDLYTPRHVEGAPIIVFFYGGSWQGGAKETYLFAAATLAARGYVVVVPDYRVYPDAKFPEFLNDAARALRWARDNAATFGGDPTRLFVMGHSAGAYIAAMLALDDTWLGPVGLDPKRDIAGLIGLAGPYDFLPLKDPTLKIIFDGDRPLTQPISYANGRKPPALLLAGTADDTVDPDNSARLAKALQRAGNDATHLLYRRVGHISMLGALAPFIANWFPVIRDVDAFIARVPPAGAHDADLSTDADADRLRSENRVRTGAGGGI